MNQTNLARFADVCRTQGITAALLSSPWTIAWLTGYAPSIQTGPSTFEGGPALGWWCEGELALITSDAEAGPVRAAGAAVHDYVGYTIDESLAVVERMARVLGEVLTGAAGRGAVVGVEMRFLPAVLLDRAQSALDGATLRPIDGALEGERAIKTPEEIARLQAALALCDLAQATVAENLRAGLSEIALWGQVKARMEVQAGERVPVLADLVGGSRTGDIGGPPGPYVLQPGDPVIADIVPRFDGYWGDNCGTHFVGTPGADMARIYGLVRDALRRGIDAVRPGLRARDLDGLLRETIRATGYPVYPHHSGHGLGVSSHEEPRLVPYNDMPLAPGMVVALEPGIYLPGIGGVRLEDVVLVTDTSCELLTRHLI
jgi:Xaa-Pro dipeptidase